jgi:hypothetical protein
MKQKTLIKNTLATGTFFQVNKTLLRYVGNANACIILSSLISKHTYFENESKLDGDSFFNTKQMITDETGFTEQSILRAEKILVRLGLISTALKPLPKQCKRVKFYTINWKSLEYILYNHVHVPMNITSTLPLESVVRATDNSAVNDNHLITPTNNNKDNNNRENNKEIVDGTLEVVKTLHTLNQSFIWEQEQIEKARKMREQMNF